MLREKAVTGRDRTMTRDFKINTAMLPKNNV